MNGNPKLPEIRGMKNCIAIAALLAAALSISGNATAQEVVKKSASGLCHCPGGQFYDRTNNFEPFENLNACLASGGREPQSGQGNCPLATAVNPRNSEFEFNNPASIPVKKSESGLCHCPGGQFYDRTNNFEPFENLNACLASGGREPQSGQGDCSLATGNGSDSDVNFSNSTSDPVKRSESGLCHCPGGQFYDRTTNFTPFDTIGACLASGGREPQQGQGTCPTEPPPSITSLEIYDRSAFGGWADADDDCQNTRHERLEARSLDYVETTEDGCRIVTGHWNDFYTGEIVSVSRELDIDHVVPLRWAWERGASNWEPGKRREFANEPANLLPVSASANRSKGASGPLEWLPPDESFACEYVLRFSRVTDMYELEIPAEEATLLEQLTSEQCD